jgi:hypothetical protein
VPLLTEKHFDDLVAFGRALAALRAKRGEIRERTIHLVNGRIGDVVIESPIHQIANT